MGQQAATMVTARTTSNNKGNSKDNKGNSKDNNGNSEDNKQQQNSLTFCRI
jgi:hypothetical protein